LRRFFYRRQNLFGLILVCLFILAAILTPSLNETGNLVEDNGFQTVNKLKGFDPHPPSSTAWLGTIPRNPIQNQVDVLHTILSGTRSELRFGLIVALTTAIIGILIGSSSAYLGGWINSLAMRGTDAFLAFPVIAGIVLVRQLILMGVQSSGIFVFPNGAYEIIGKPTSLQALLFSLDPVMLALILFSWMPYARIINSMVQRTKNEEYVQAARTIGMRNSRIILRHIIPNTISPAIVLAARDVGGIVLLQASFSFIGMGGNSTWGNLLALGRNWIIAPGGNPLVYWWAFIPATFALVFFGIGWNLLGDGVNDWLDPRTRVK
jgi:peptide/nickel transport system permease protein